MIGCRGGHCPPGNWMLRIRIGLRRIRTILPPGDQWSPLHCFRRIEPGGFFSRIDNKYLKSRIDSPGTGPGGFFSRIDNKYPKSRIDSPGTGPGGFYLRNDM